MGSTIETRRDSTSKKRELKSEIIGCSMRGGNSGSRSDGTRGGRNY